MRRHEYDGMRYVALGLMNNAYSGTRSAGGYSLLPGTQSWALVVDRRLTDCHISELLSYYLGGVSYRHVSYFVRTLMTHWTIGQLYLGVFSGPVEGIIMIVIIYLISGILGELPPVGRGPTYTEKVSRSRILGYPCPYILET